ncbi:MAG: rRNA maturation RNase YbeY [Chloroflexi bacterium]|nr:rRNA maturation RNase YbeY [Chloroflexota bacterium]MCL5107964.1 rRNA maturation RNase YbeY [Chloroflexota bacterium]
MDRPLFVRLVPDIPPEWEAEVDLRLLADVAETALSREGWQGPVEVDVTLVDDAAIQELNARYRGVDAATDVLSFPLLDSSGTEDAFVLPPGELRQLGDIVISLPRATAQAAEYGHSRQRELAYLFVHGLLHLLGYDHESLAEREAMRAKEETALAALGLTR